MGPVAKKPQGEPAAVALSTTSNLKKFLLDWEGSEHSKEIWK